MIAASHRDAASSGDMGIGTLVTIYTADGDQLCDRMILPYGKLRGDEAVNLRDEGDETAGLHTIAPPAARRVAGRGVFLLASVVES